MLLKEKGDVNTLDSHLHQIDGDMHTLHNRKVARFKLLSLVSAIPVKNAKANFSCHGHIFMAADMQASSQPGRESKICGRCGGISGNMKKYVGNMKC